MLFPPQRAVRRKMCGAFMSETIACSVGFDPSLANTGCARLRFAWCNSKRLARVLGWSTDTCVTSPRSVMGERLHSIAEFAVEQVEAARRELSAMHKRHSEMCLGMENFSFNSKFGLPAVGQVVGAIRSAIWTRCGQEDITMHAIGNIKRLAVPSWPGYSREAWVKAGYAKSKFKRSNPTKIAVASGLSVRFGIHLMNEHEVDAMVVAIAAANKVYGIKPEMWRKDG